MRELNALQFAQRLTSCNGRIQTIKGATASTGGVQEALGEAKVYVLTERRLGSTLVQEVQNVGVTPGGDLTIVTIPPKLTFDTVLYQARWAALFVGAAVFVALGYWIGQH